MARSTTGGPSGSGAYGYRDNVPPPPNHDPYGYQQSEAQPQQPGQFQQLYGMWAQGYVSQTPPPIQEQRPPAQQGLPPGAQRPNNYHPYSHSSSSNTNPFDIPSQPNTPPQNTIPNASNLPPTTRPRVNTGQQPALPNPYDDDPQTTPVARSSSQSQLDSWYGSGGAHAYASGGMGGSSGSGGGLRPQMMGHSVSHANLRGASQAQAAPDRPPPSYTPADDWAFPPEGSKPSGPRNRAMSHAALNSSYPPPPAAAGWGLADEGGAGRGSSTIVQPTMSFPMPDLQLPNIAELQISPISTAAVPTPPHLQPQRNRHASSIGLTRPSVPPSAFSPPPPVPQMQHSQSSSGSLGMTPDPPPRPATGPPRPDPPQYSHSDYTGSTGPNGAPAVQEKRPTPPTNLGRATTFTPGSTTPSPSDTKSHGGLAGRSSSASASRPSSSSPRPPVVPGPKSRSDSYGSTTPSTPASTTSSGVNSPLNPNTPTTASSATSFASAKEREAFGNRAMNFNNASLASFHPGREGFHDALASPVESSFSFEQDESTMASEWSTLSQDMEENIRRFQSNELAEADQEWHKLVPAGALESLSKDDIARQSTIFELFKAEREYVADLELIDQVAVRGLKEAKPAVIPEHQVDGFIAEVFLNYKEILGYHKAMLKQLFERQETEHPFVEKVGDIVLEVAFIPEYRKAYETYIKANVLAESVHQKQLSSNPAYAAFLETVSSDPRIKKRDLKIFLARPVTRLPRLRLLLEAMLKKTDPEHPDHNSLQIAVEVLGDTVKSSQPGIEAAQSRVNFMDICEHLVFTKGEIIDLDLFDKERHLVHVGPVWTKEKSEGSFSSGEKWVEQQAALLDNAFVIYREKRISPTVTKKYVVRRPIPLSFIRLASFTSEAHPRKEDSGILDFRERATVLMYPFTFYHATSMKAYNLFVTSEAVRKKWNTSFVDALSIFKVRQETNPWFSQEIISDGFFRIPRDAATKATGKLSCAVPFSTPKGRFLAVASTTGIYVGKYGSNESRQILSLNAGYIAAIPSPLNKFIIHFDTSVLSYSLEAVALLALGQTNASTLEASRQRVAPADQTVTFVRHLIVGDTHSSRHLLVYASKKRMSNSCYVHAVEALTDSITVKNKKTSFRSLGQPGTIPKDAYDVSSLTRTIGICTRDGVVTADPTSLVTSASPPIPVLSEAATSPAVALLKSQVDASRPLGFLRVSSSEILVVYEDLGCYINTKGLPTRSNGFLKWETKITSYACRSPYVFLVSSRFIEIRNIGNGRLLQVVEGGDIRLIYGGTGGSSTQNSQQDNSQDNVLVAMRGRFNDKNGLSEKIVELVPTEEIGPGGQWGPNNGEGPSNGTGQGQGMNGGQPIPQQVWAEWDM
ncbi:hypothetical protein BKA70DRAFT_1261943 [Coprinopsis sp. MPI-PUGE-AT-0042]|nr:hypothetical protein BKA70DRAFT_1261943 [Coprinopsis sp. MPI-PUGE-AT-0042]